MRGTDNIYGVILAGGSGERLWPLSTKNKPKQLLTINKNKTLLSQTFERLSYAITPQHLWITTSQDHEKVIRETITEQVITEPVSKNTAAALLLSCLRIQQKDNDGVVAFVPADHYIPESSWNLFAQAVQNALTLAQQKEVLVLLGVPPTKPATSYGYIEYDPHTSEGGASLIHFFHEKPSFILAQEYITQKTMLWNTGIFCGTVSTFIHEYQQHAPQLYEAMIAYLEGKGSYEDLSHISFDHAIMEKSTSSWVVPAPFEWYDVGTIEAFLSLKKDDESQKMVTIDASNNLVEVPNKLVALVGVDDLCVVEVENVLLITKRTHGESVRNIVQNLKEHNEYEYL